MNTLNNDNQLQASLVRLYVALGVSGMLVSNRRKIESLIKGLDYRDFDTLEQIILLLGENVGSVRRQLNSKKVVRMICVNSLAEELKASRS